MRCSTLLAATFAIGALAGPLRKRQDVVVDEVDVTVDVTDIVATVTVTPGAPAPSDTSVAAPAPTPVAAESPAAHPAHRQGQHSWSNTWSQPIVTTTVAPAAPPPPAPTTTEVAAPPPSSAAPPPPPSSSSSEEAAPSSSAQAGLSDFQTLVLGHHNVHRANHSAGALTYSTELESIAQTVVGMCNSTHQMNVGSGNYGQNYYFSSDNPSVGSAVSDGWYNGEEPNYANFYGQATPSTINDDTAFDTYGHFTQLVWQAAGEVGCAVGQCSSYVDQTGPAAFPYMFACNYRSSGAGDGTNGNMIGSFNTNVAEPSGQPTFLGSDNDFPSS